MSRPQVPGHLALLAGRRPNGEAVFEVVPADSRPDGLWRLLGTPALAEGCAEGDVLRVDEQGDFKVEERGGNIAVISYGGQGHSLKPHVASLRLVLEQLGAKVEHPSDVRWLVATVPVESGFPAIEAAMATWAQESGCTWSYGNVYDENDQPLDWW